MAFHTNKEISVYSEDDNAKISKKDIQLKESSQKLSEKLQSEVSPNKNFRNYFFDDCESIKGRYSWIEIDEFHLPVITRVINGEHLKLVSVQMVETKLIKHYLHSLHEDAYNYISVRSHYIVNSEAKLLNEINFNCNKVFGEYTFIAGRDCIVLLKDIREFYEFLKFCSDKLIMNNANHDTKCGYIRLYNQSIESIVPYIIVDANKYVPLLYFDGKIKVKNSLKLKKWNLAYLKFLVLIQGLTHKIMADNFCIVVKLDDIKAHYSLDFFFDLRWPLDKYFAKLFLTFYPSHPRSAWTRNSLIPTPKKKCILPESVTPAITTNTYQIELSKNRMGSTIALRDSSMISVDRINPPPPKIRESNWTSIIRSNGQLREVADSNDWFKAVMSNSERSNQIIIIPDETLTVAEETGPSSTSNIM